MRVTLSVLVLLSAALVRSSPSQASGDNGNNGQFVPADKNFLKKQLQIAQFFKNIQEPNQDMEQQQIGNSFNLNNEAGNFSNSQVVKAFQQQVAQGMTPQGQTFDISSNQQRQEVIKMFDLFYFAKDYDTFYRAACYARDRFNAGQFVYALSVAVMHRPDTQGIVLPPIYEVFPHLFVDSVAMQQVYNAKIQGQNNFQVHANYSNCPRNCQFTNCQNQPNSQNCQNCQSCDLVNWSNNNNNNNDDNNNNGNNNGFNENNFNSNSNPNNQVSYFNEDVGVNAFNYYFNLQYPFWMDNKKYNQNKARQGELFFYQNQQLLARYNLERYGNNLDAVQPLQIQENGVVCIQEGHNPTISFENGDNMPNRPDNFCVGQNKNNQNGQNNNNNNNFNNGENDNNNCGNSQNGNACGQNGVNSNQKISQYQRRIYDAIDNGFIYNQDGNKVSLNEKNNGADVLGRIVQANSDYVNGNYFGNNGFFNEIQKLVGRATDPFNRHSVAPAAISQHETALRDNAYFSLLSNVHNIQQYYKSKQPSYTNQDLGFNGVQVQNVEVEKLVTYFDNFFMDVNNAIRGNNNGGNDNNNNNNNNFQVKQQRLNHKPFSYTINVQSNQAAEAIVRVFIGPKTNANLNNNQANSQNNNNNRNQNNQGLPLEQARPFFVELDRFKVNLVEGQNKIVRNAKDSSNNVNDYQSFRNLVQKAQQALDGSSPFYVSQVDNYHCGYPKRMQLPRGKVNGQEYSFFVIVNSAEDKQNNNDNNNNQVDNYLSCSNQKVFDNRPMGFPFDRPVSTAEFNNNVDNAFFKNVMIYHKNANQVQRYFHRSL